MNKERDINQIRKALYVTVLFYFIFSSFAPFSSFSSLKYNLNVGEVLSRVIPWLPLNLSLSIREKSTHSLKLNGNYFLLRCMIDR